MADHYDVAVDFMDMTDARRLWARPVDARADLDLSVGRHVIVGDEDADPRVARIVAVDEDGNLDLEVLEARSSRTPTSSHRPDAGPENPRKSRGKPADQTD